MNLKPQHLKSVWNKKTVLFVSLALIFAACLGVTAAWLSDKDLGATHSFGPAQVSCQVVNSYDNAAVQNTDTVNEHIRVKIIVHYREKLAGGGYGSLWPQPAVEGSDYTFTYNLNDWVQGADGYFYCKAPVAPGATTPQLINGVSPDFSRVPAGYEMRIEYLAEAIQSDPNGRPATEAWKATVDGNNYITGAQGFSN